MEKLLARIDATVARRRVQAAERGRFPWWWVLAGGVLVLVALVAWWFLSRRDSAELAQLRHEKMSAALDAEKRVIAERVIAHDATTAQAKAQAKAMIAEADAAEERLADARSAHADRRAVLDRIRSWRDLDGGASAR